MTQSYHASEALEYIMYKSWTTFMMFLMSSRSPSTFIINKGSKGGFPIDATEEPFWVP